MRRTITIVAAVAVILGLSASVASAHKRHWWPHKPAGTIVDVAVKASSADGPDANPYDYDLLIAAVTATGLAPTLADQSQRFTVFAPNDRAFVRLVARPHRQLPGERAGDARRRPRHVHAGPDQEHPALPRGRRRGRSARCRCCSRAR